MNLIESVNLSLSNMHRPTHTKMYKFKQLEILSLTSAILIQTKNVRGSDTENVIEIQIFVKFYTEYFNVISDVVKVELH